MQPLDLPLTELALKGLVLVRPYLAGEAGHCVDLRGPEVPASTSLRDTPQRDLVQLRDDGAALGILWVAGDLAPVVVFRDRPAIGRAEPDGVYDRIILRGLPGRRNGIALVTLAVRHDNDDSLTHPLIAEAHHRGRNRLPDHGALSADRTGAGIVNVGLGGGVVGRHWELYETGAREQDDANRVTFQP